MREVGILLGFTMIMAFASGCPTGEAPPKPVDVCEKVGQRCYFSAGKVGLCTVTRDCMDDKCLTCASQH